MRRYSVNNFHGEAWAGDDEDGDYVEFNEAAAEIAKRDARIEDLKAMLETVTNCLDPFTRYPNGATSSLVDESRALLEAGK